MTILPKIAWRNIWRNKRRSWVLISAIAVGVFSYVGGTAILNGFVDQMVDSAIRYQGGHIQIAAKGYHENPGIRLVIENPDQVVAAAERIPGSTPETIVRLEGMATSAERSAGVLIQGIDPSRRIGSGSIAYTILEGEFLSGDPEGSVLMGHELAGQLNLRIGERLVLMVADRDNEIQSAAFRVGGLYRTANAEFDKAAVFLHLRDAQSLAGYGDALSGISVFLDHPERLDEAAATLRASLGDPSLEVLTWRQRFPLLLAVLDFMDVFAAVVLIILFTAIALSIVNSFLMVIFERIRELGIMMANGVRPRQIRIMLYLEAAFILGIGLLAGVAFAGLLIGTLSTTGLNLAAFAAGLQAYGVDAVLYPSIHADQMTTGLITIVVIVLLAILYPSIKASRFEVVDALRHT